MDVFVLDSQLRRIQVFDVYESFIWAERFIPDGDFKLVISNKANNLSYLTEGAWLVINDSERVMVIETVEEAQNAEGLGVLNISGRSIESILKERIARFALSNLEVEPRWVTTGKPVDVVKYVFRHICIDGSLDKRDILPFIKQGSIFPESTVPVPLDEYTIAMDPATLFDTLVDICQTFGLGFALVRNLDKSELYFEVYSGSDRTSAQKVLPSVIFSTELDSLNNTTSLVSIQDYKNVAYVISPLGARTVYAEGYDSAAAGFKRRVLLVKIDSLEPEKGEEGLSIQELLQRRGQSALNEHQRLSAFDGEIPSHGHKYNKDYRLGDIVEMRNAYGETKYMRVTEQIFSSDAEGDKSYPTLSLHKYITPDSWHGWNTIAEWSDVEETWDEM